MSNSAVAERYGRAIFELADESGQAAGLTQQLANFAAVYSQSHDLHAVVGNPLISHADRDEVLKQIASRLGLSPLATTAVRYIASRRRMAALPEIARRLGSLADEKAGVLRASVTSAGQLSESYYEKLKAELEGITGRKVVLERKQDPSLIAGVVTRIGDNTIDGSVRGKLDQIERQLQSA
ncbi:MAG TPA: ATP synthase F1 subunit delta [Polyangiaceae bacterium]|nr:ATP synthase F1 subunit delta [Polyangiaceae bacterium]